MASFQLLKKLVDANAISGFEHTVREVIEKELKPFADEIHIDRIGNLIARKGRGKPVVMLAAHMDELGLMVKHINEKGFIHFETVGGWDDRLLPGLKVQIHGSKGPVIGIIGTKPPHLQEKEEQKKPFSLKELFIDIGARNAKDVERAGIRVGDFITRYCEMNKMLGSRVTGAGFDNRAGCAAMVEVFQRAKGFKGTLYAVGTIQEELGLIGVRGPTFGINPDVVLALDVTIAGDTPTVKFEEAPIKLGSGPVLVIKDAGGVTNPKVRKWIEQSANGARIPLQFEVVSGGMTDATIPPMIREGIPSGTIAIPSRYIHSPVEVIDMNDLENTIKLTIASIKTANKFF